MPPLGKCAKFVALPGQLAVVDQVILLVGVLVMDREARVLHRLELEVARSGVDSEEAVCDFELLLLSPRWRRSRAMLTEFVVLR